MPEAQPYVEEEEPPPPPEWVAQLTKDSQPEDPFPEETEPRHFPVDRDATEPPPLPLPNKLKPKLPVPGGRPLSPAPEPAPEDDSAITSPPQAEGDASEEAVPVRRVSPVRRLLAILVFSAVVGLLLVLALAFFLKGGNTDAPAPDPEASSAMADIKQLPTVLPAIDQPAYTIDPDSSDLQSFLQQLRAHQLRPSSQPEGVFVDTVFVPVGALLRPDLGLRLSAIQEINGHPHLILSLPEAEPLALPLQPTP